MTEKIALTALTALLFFALIATLAFGSVYDSRKQLGSEESPPPEEARESAALLFGSLALSALFIGLLALWGGK